MNRIAVALLCFSLLAGCNRDKTKQAAGDPAAPIPAKPRNADTPKASGSLMEARQGFQSKLTAPAGDKQPVDEPPTALFRKVQYTSPAGNLAAYLTPDPKDGKKHPAIIWITGGDCNSIDKGSWDEGTPANHQSASAFRKAGIAMMFPALRGGNDNPGRKEGFLGEVDDVLAAADFLAKQEFVDPKRIYLGGHSTGGTLVLLVSECTGRFRAVFSFGPTNDVSGYGPEFTPFDRTNPQEVALRSPGRWLAEITSPTFVIEGAVQGNLAALLAMKKSSTNRQVHFLTARRANHFSVLYPATRLLATKVVQDDGETCNISVTEDELNKPASK